MFDPKRSKRLYFNRKYRSRYYTCKARVPPEKEPKPRTVRKHSKLESKLFFAKERMIKLGRWDKPMLVLFEYEERESIQGYFKSKGLAVKFAKRSAAIFAYVDDLAGNLTTIYKP